MANFLRLLAMGLLMPYENIVHYTRYELKDYLDVAWSANAESTPFARSRRHLRTRLIRC